MSFDKSVNIITDQNKVVFLLIVAGVCVCVCLSLSLVDLGLLCVTAAGQLSVCVSDSM